MKRFHLVPGLTLLVIFLLTGQYIVIAPLGIFATAAGVLLHLFSGMRPQEKGTQSS
jgi:hypothetical protein